VANKKPLEPGKTFSVKLPVDIPEETLSYLNGLEKRNNEMLNLIESAAKRNNRIDNNSINVDLEYKLSNEERKFLEDPITQKSIAAFITMIIGGSTTITVNQMNKQIANNDIIEEDFSDFDNLVDIE